MKKNVYSSATTFYCIIMCKNKSRPAKKIFHVYTQGNKITFPCYTGK